MLFKTIVFKHCYRSLTRLTIIKETYLCGFFFFWNGEKKNKRKKRNKKEKQKKKKKALFSLMAELFLPPIDWTIFPSFIFIRYFELRWKLCIWGFEGKPSSLFLTWIMLQNHLGSFLKNTDDWDSLPEILT